MSMMIGEVLWGKNIGSKHVLGEKRKRYGEVDVN